MNRMKTKLLLIGLLAVAALVVCTSEANALWGHRAYYSYYSPAGCGYSSCYTPSCYSYGCYSPCTVGSCYTYARPRFVYGCYRPACYSYGCSPCYTSCCDPCGTTSCSPCSYGSSCDTTDACCQPSDGSDGSGSPTPALPESDGNQMEVDSGMTTAYPNYEESGQITVWLPSEAKVTINGHETSTKGSKRRYVSTGLQPGLVYKYEICAKLPRDGKMAEETKTVYLTAGSTEGVAFGFNRKPITVASAQ